MKWTTRLLVLILLTLLLATTACTRARSTADYRNTARSTSHYRTKDDEAFIVDRVRREMGNIEFRWRLRL